MDKEVDLEHFKNFKYDVVIKKRGKKFVLVIPELGIIEEDDNLEKAYQRVEAGKEKHFQKIIQFDLQDEIVEPKKVIAEKLDSKKIFITNIAIFVTKVIIILFIATLAVNFISDRIGNITSVSISQFVNEKAKSCYNRLHDIPDEKIEKTKLQVRNAIKKFKPILNEFKVLLHDDAQQNAAAVSPGNSNE
ncbi:MAG: hypothetical protein M0R48_02550 [Candidatus Omnitrophica bacterium]|nr:hypothetical protein [Candidatus Omnitrophota bacterium]